MKPRIIHILAILAILLSSFSCINSRNINVEISYDQFSQNNHIRNEFQAGIGDKITIKLSSNPTTGFKWEYKTTVENIIKEEDHHFQEPKGNVVGAAGIEVWTFEAVGKGTTEIQMEYSRPWEGGEKAEWAYTVTVTVE